MNLWIQYFHFNNSKALDGPYNYFTLCISREFTLAEIEHFCDPTDKSHPKFKNVRNTQILLYSACDQMDGKAPSVLSIGEAVDSVSYIFIVSDWLLNIKVIQKRLLTPFKFIYLIKYLNLKFLLNEIASQV